jgi:hypothetical protein
MAVSLKNPVGSGVRHWNSALAALAIAILLPAEGLGQPPSKVSPRTLTKVSQIRALSAEEAGRKYPIHLQGVITYAAPEYQVTFFQDDTAGIFLWVGDTDLPLAAGRLVQIDGNTTPGDFAPSIENAKIHVLGLVALPAAPRESLDRLLTGVDDSQWVSVQGVVHSVTIEDRLPPDMRKGPPRLVLGIASGSNQFKARIRQFPPDRGYRNLVDATITISGACGTLFNKRRQLTGLERPYPLSAASCSSARRLPPAGGCTSAALSPCEVRAPAWWCKTTRVESPSKPARRRRFPRAIWWTPSGFPPSDGMPRSCGTAIFAGSEASGCRRP